MFDVNTCGFGSLRDLVDLEDLVSVVRLCANRSRKVTTVRPRVKVCVFCGYGKSVAC